MIPSSILITFSEVPAVNEQIQFEESLLNIDFLQIFKSGRLAANQTKIPFYNGTDDQYIGYISNNLKTALNLDVNSNNLFSIFTTVGADGTGIGTIRITANYPNAVFSLISNTSSATIEIFNQTEVPTFNFTDIFFSEASYNPEKRCKINISTSTLATSILSPVVSTNVSNPIVGDFLRKTTFNLKLRDANGIIIERFITFPDYLVAENFTLKINNSPTGATVIVEKINSEGLELQYSLDGVTWQDENVFSGLDSDNFTLYIKDQLGWQVTKDFVIDEFAINSPFFYISKSNSIRYAQRVVFGDAANYKKDENTLSCEVLLKNPYKELQLFQSADVVTNQFKSNYETNVVKVIQENFTTIPGNANLLLYSNDLSNSIWEKTNTEISGEKIISSVTVGTQKHWIKQILDITDTLNKTYNFSFYIKAGELSAFTLFVIDSIDTNGVYGSINLSTGVIDGSGQFGSCVLNNLTSSNEGGGWYRLSYDFTVGIETDLTIQLYMAKEGADEYIGNGTDGLYVKNFQIKEGVLSEYLQTTSTTIINEDFDGTTLIPVIKKTSNIGNKDKRDAIKFNYGNGKTGIYFQSGYTYNYETNAFNGFFALNGYLPFWASSGNYVAIGSAWFLIEDVVFDESRNCEAIIISAEYTGVDVDIIVASIFNYKNYEVYEFSIDMLDYLDEDIRVKIEATDDSFSAITYLSELLNVKVKQENTIEIRYKNSDNTDIYYQTGIEFKIRQEFQKISGITEQKSEDYRTDTNVVLLNADIYEGDEFLLEPVTKGMMHTIIRALSHESVFINEVGYVKADAVDVEGPLEDSNLYVIKAKMLKNGNVYNSQASGNDNQIYNGENVEVPGLVDYGGGFVRY